MVKRKTFIFIIILMVVFISSISVMALASPGFHNRNEYNNFYYVEQNLMSSSRYTTKEEKDEEKYQEYLNNYTLKYTEAEVLLKNYVKTAENDQLSLYFHSTSFSILIYNKITDYWWSSKAEFTVENEANRSKQNEMNSGILVEYVITNNISRRTSNSNILEEKATITHRALSSNLGFQATVNFLSLGFKFEVIVSIEDNILKVSIDHESIEESLPRYTLIGLQLFPYLGSARQDKLPGYIFIPDGVGALVRFQERSNTSYLTRYYGDDYGYSQSIVNRNQLSAPVFGIVHDVDQNGIFGIIESGDTMARLGAYFWGFEGINYFRTSPKYYYREIYTNVIDKKGGGAETVSKSIKPIDIEVRYIILSGNQANYVGMANAYKEHLEAKAIFTKQTKHNADIPLAIDYIMSELEPSFFGSRIVRMTSPNDVTRIYQNFKDSNIKDQKLNILGWSVSGIFDTAPYKVKYSDSKRDYKELINLIEADENDIYFQTNYISSTASSKRVTSKDIARQMSKLKMTVKTSNYFELSKETNYLYPHASYNFAKDDFNNFRKLGINKLSFSLLGNTLFSYYHSGIRYNRSDSLAYYHDLLNIYGKSGFYNPNAYMYQYTSDYFNLPLYNSQHNYFTDLVPFLPIVLKGNIEYYSHYLNFNSIGIDQILNLIDFGVNPSFIITQEQTTKMRYTKANHYYSTYYHDLQNTIIDQYHYINDALKQVNGYQIVNREVIESGIVAVLYSNNKTIYVNYTSNDYVMDGIIIKAKDYKVL